MSSASSAVTYTFVYTDSEPGRVFWGADVELSDGQDGPVDYPMDGGDDGDDDDDDYSSGMTLTMRMRTRRRSTWLRLTPLLLYLLMSLFPHLREQSLSYHHHSLTLLPLELGLPSPLPPPLHMPPPVNRRDDISETEMPPRKRLCFSTLGSRDTWVDPTETVAEITPITVGEVNTRVTELAELHEHDTQDLYALLEDAQDSRTRISERVVVDSQRVDLLMEDRIAHQETIQIMEDEAYAAREAWGHSIGLSQAVHSELQTHQEQVYAYEF
nr:hypothetical protein [Tanacetum cinerariifolium]